MICIKKPLPHGQMQTPVPGENLYPPAPQPNDDDDGGLREELPLK